MIVWNKIKHGHYESEDKRFLIRRSWWWGKGVHYHLFDKENFKRDKYNGFCGFVYEAYSVGQCKLKAEELESEEK